MFLFVRSYDRMFPSRQYEHYLEVDDLNEALSLIYDDYIVYGRGTPVVLSIQVFDESLQEFVNTDLLDSLCVPVPLT